ncbi:hypothetical protein GCM10011491_30690 [Brucella endophytica]|uniref:Uncharacterized protein n=1 Tax=Brucella endophytica TaxID=1963359 RepID=A0A916SK65_9HYPH|nr:hypothetical protein [Brucella endophytica]GGB00370.1 hypothetical protein GCM10011491_30690 [Brucella endophytica]
MTPLGISELFIRAAEVDHRLPDTASPKTLKAQNLPYVHDQADQNGWGEERYQEERESFFRSRLSHEQVSEWELCNTLILFIEDETRRRCLWHWAIAQAGGKPFSVWCRAEGFHVETGRRRKNRAILELYAALVRNGLINNENTYFEMLRVGPENGHIHVNIGDDAPNKQPVTWRDDFALVDDETIRDLDWAEARNKRRRQKYAARKKAA